MKNARNQSGSKPVKVKSHGEGGMVLECAGMTALWDSTTCRRVPKRRLVAALQKPTLAPVGSQRPVRAPGLQEGNCPPCRPGPLTRRRSAACHAAQASLRIQGILSHLKVFQGISRQKNFRGRIPSPAPGPWTRKSSPIRPNPSKSNPRPRKAD